jgi:hypothetical protein
MTNKFDLNQAGNRRFVTAKTARSKWNENQSVMEITEDQVVLSKPLCEALNLRDEGLATIYYHEDGIYVANITNETVENPNEVVLRPTKVQGYASDFFGARTARNKKVIVDARAKALDENNELLYPNGVYELEEVVPNTFPVVKLKLQNPK